MSTTFWHRHPILQLEQRYHSDVFLYGFYPNADLVNVHGWSDERKATLTDRYTTDRLGEILQWCNDNCRGHAIHSEKYGSVAFMRKEDAVLFMLFFPEEHMPPPKIDNPTYPWQYQDRKIGLL